MLPIAEFRDAIVASVASNPVTLIEGATGSGKTTQVPQFLLDAGRKVVVVQPRRLAARSLAERVAEERGVRIGDEVGYQIAGERVASERTRCLFATTGLALVRSLFSGIECGYNTLVLDEWHERGEDMDVLAAYWKMQVESGSSRVRIVVMSATMDAARLSTYFGGAPIISVPGRTFPITTVAPESLLDSDGDGMIALWGPISRQTAAFVAGGRNTLVFVPGKGEIVEVCTRLAQIGIDALPLHGGLSKGEQAECFRRPRNGSRAIVATNVAQTSITIDYIDAVVDSGLERRTEVVSGVQGLYLRLISEADAAQRRGRAGRTKPGISVDFAPLIAATPRLARVVMPPSGELRAKWPTPELQRVLLDCAVLRLAQAGFDLETLPVFDPLDPAEISQAKRVLRALGCMAEGIAVTPMGTRVASLPVGVRQGRMLVEASDRGCLREALSLAAILEGQGITDRNNVHPEMHAKAGRQVWRDHVADPLSDHISFLRLFERAERMPDRGRSIGCHGKAVGDAMELRRRLADETGKHLKVSHAKPATREEVLACVLVSQIDQLRPYVGTDRWGNPKWGSDARKLGDSTVVSGQPAWVVGTPFDVSTKKGGRLSLLQFVSVIDPAMVPASAVETKESSPRYDAATDRVVAQVDVFAAPVCQYAAGNPLSRTDVPVTDSRAPVALVDGLVRAICGEYTRDIADSHRDALRAVIEGRSAARDLNARVGLERYPCGSDEQLRAFVASAVGSAVRLADVPASRFALEIVSDAEIERVKALHPDAIEIAGQSYSVAYSLGPAPVVECLESTILAFPDALRTPGGRVVECSVRFGWYDQRRTTDIAALKAYAKERASKLVFDDWRDRPVIEDDEIHEFVSESGFVAYGCRVDPRDNETRWSLSRTETEERLERSLIGAMQSEWSSSRYELQSDHSLFSESPATVSEWRAFIVRVRAAVAQIAAEKAAFEAIAEAGVDAVIAACAASPVDADGYALYGHADPSRDVALEIFRFVQGILATMSASTAQMLLRSNNELLYGRARRTAAIAECFPGVAYSGLDWNRDLEVLRIYVDSLVPTAAPKVRRNEKPQSVSAPSIGATLADLSAKFGKRR